MFSIASKFLLVLEFFALALIFFLPNYSLVLAANYSVSGSAWSAQIGWVNFGASNGNAALNNSYLTGYAWNENYGWLHFSPSNNVLLTNDGKGNLGGKAWMQGTGWIDFSGVKVNSSGVFTGTASGDNSVSLNFDCTRCNVTTGWRAPSQTQGGVIPVYSSPGSISPSPTGPVSVSVLSVIINDGDAYTNNPLVNLSLNASGFGKMSISNSSDFSGVLQETYQKNKSWNLAGGDGQKTVYAKFYASGGSASQIVSANIILDRQAPEISVTSSKEKYALDEQVLIGGSVSKPNASISVLIDNNSYAGLVADGQGQWNANLGTMALGDHKVAFVATDLAGNKSKTVEASFSVERGVVLAPPLAPILQKLEGLVKPLIPQLFAPITTAPPPLIIITKETPAALQGLVNYLPQAPLSNFVLAPLPPGIKLLAQQFPQVEKTFQEVGVQRLTDVQKLTSTQFQLPNLNEAVAPATPFSTPKGVSIDGLSQAARVKIPPNIVFVKTGGGFVDFNTALVIGGKGQAFQKIQTVADQTLQLIIKADKPVKTVRGYLVFKTTKSNQPAFKIPINSLSASLPFKNPDFTSNVTPFSQVPLEGSKSIQIENKNSENQQPIEQRLVLREFEFENKGSNLYSAQINVPKGDGEYDIIIVLDDGKLPKEIRLIAVVDPEGYIYEKKGELETRISGAQVSLYWLNPVTRQYEIWPAKDFQQINPQVTDARGTYSFLVPNGFYYLKVDSPGYLSYNGTPFEVTEGSGIHTNIELKKIWLLSFFNWQDIVIILVLFLLGYNFYRDRMKAKKPENTVFSGKYQEMRGKPVFSDDYQKVQANQQNQTPADPQKKSGIAGQ